jgi:hypothetical protein
MKFGEGSYEIEVAKVKSEPAPVTLMVTKIARTIFEVRDADLVLPIILRAGASTTVHVQQERDGQRNSLAGIPVRLVPEEFLGVAEVTTLLATTGPDGTLTLPGVSPGLYRVQLPLYTETAEQESLNTATFSSAPKNLCVRDIQLNDTSVAGDYVNITGDAASLTIVLRESIADIRGGLGAQGANATVVLIPKDRQQTQAYVSTLADSEGNFELKCAMTGDYRLYAWSDLPGAAYRNEQFMADYRDQGTAVRVSAGEAVTVQTTLIEP